MYKKNIKLNKKNGIVIGLTGNIGSGKTFVLKLLKKFGFYTESADEIVQKEYDNKNSEFYKAVVSLFKTKNKQILNTDFSINKKKILEIIKIDKELLIELNKITKKIIIKKIKNQIISMKKSYKFSAIEIPLLFEMDMHIEKIFNIILIIKTHPDIVKNRILKKRDMDEKTYNFLIENQNNTNEKIVDKIIYIIYNNASKQILIKKIKYFIKLVKTLC